MARQKNARTRRARDGRPELRPLGEPFLNGAVWSQAYRGRGVTVFRLLRPTIPAELAAVAALSWAERARMRMPADPGSPTGGDGA